jgi:hypothetical protein
MFRTGRPWPSYTVCLGIYCVSMYRRQWHESSENYAAVFILHSACEEALVPAAPPLLTCPPTFYAFMLSGLKVNGRRWGHARFSTCFFFRNYLMNFVLISWIKFLLNFVDWIHFTMFRRIMAPGIQSTQKVDSRSDSLMDIETKNSLHTISTDA